MNRDGFTLVELLVVLVILGITLGVVGLAVGGNSGPVTDGAKARIAEARAAAIRTGKPVRILVETGSAPDSSLAAPQRHSVTITALPDGRVIAPAELGIAPLNGRPTVAGVR